MSPKMKILYFGDQTTDYCSKLREQFHVKDVPALHSFLEKSSAVLREEVSNQPRLLRQSIPDFSSLLDVVKWLEEFKVSSPALESAICCICQISCVIIYAQTTADYISASDCRIIGSCTGLLAAAAASSSKSLSDLPVLGVTLVQIAFRIGMLVESSRARLQQGSIGRGSWSVAVAGSSENKIAALLGQFRRDESIPISNQAYVSAISASSLTISGPPSILNRLAKSSTELKSLKQVSLPIHGPYHADHLYSDDCLQRLLEPFEQLLHSYKPRVPMISSSTGQVISTPDTLGLIQIVTEEILKKPLRWDHVIEGTCTMMGQLEIAQCEVLPAGPAEMGKGLVSGLQKHRHGCVVTLGNSLWNCPSPAEGQKRLSGKLADSKIAIVGMAGRFPNAANHELFWEILENGVDTHKTIPKDRFDEAHIDPTGRRKNTSHTPYGCFMDEPGLFDPRFFRMSPREATQTDPMHRLALLTAYEALEMSGFVPNRTASTKLHRIGTFYGQTSDDWREIQEGQDIDTYFIPGGVRAFAPGRINYFFKFSGPSYSVDTACSSSFAALQLAITSLRAGDCDTAVTGGMNVLTNPDIFSGLSRGQFLSKTGNCQTFDNEADGYCRGEAVASVVLKRLEDAEADNDSILGVILASATNHSADAISITHPHAPTQEYLYKQLLNKAALDSNDICYVEMHGTGTQAGDGTEMESVTNVFAAPNHKRRPDQTLHLGAVKANIGHGEAASGISALVKVLLMMEKNAIPPNCGIKSKMNEGFPKDLEARNVRIPLRTIPWPRPDDQLRRVFVSNFSAAGGNTGLIMEDAPLIAAQSARDPRSVQIIAVSGKSKSSLRKNLHQIIDFITKFPNTHLSSLSYTTTARRTHHNYRVAVTGSDLSAMRTSLTSSLDKETSPITPTTPEVAFVFTGQGSHYAALGKQFFENSAQFRSDILQFEDMVCAQGLPSFRPLIDGEVDDIQSLSSVVVQLGLVCVQMALARLWVSWNVIPTVVLGHSLGEYAALETAGVLSASDTIHLVGRRARELEASCTPGTHAMLAVAASVSVIDPYIKDRALEIACINSHNETVLGGSCGQIDKLAEELIHKSIKATKLSTPFAFHVSQVDPILEGYGKIASGVTFNEPSIPVISPLLGDVVRSADTFDSTYMKRHARETVNFVKGIDAGIRDGVVSGKTAWVEIGPHPVCLAMIQKQVDSSIFAIPSLRRKEDAWKVICGSLASLYSYGLNIDWNEFHKDFEEAQQLLRLPSYAFDLKNYWIEYTGNWCLTKGDTLAVTDAPKTPPKLSTTSLQRIVREDIQESEAHVTMESDISEPTLRAAIQGHQVNSTALVPSSLYADMAFTIADYLHRSLVKNTETPGLSCGKMEVGKPLIASKGTDQQLVRVDGSLKTTSGQAGQVKVHFYSVSSDGRKTVDHATCIVSCVDSEAMLSNWRRHCYLIKPRIEALLNGINIGTAEKIHRNMAYALFGSFVQYGSSYRGLEEVALNSDEYEATAKVVFQTKEQDGNFLCSPYWIDSVGHLSGFVLSVHETLGDKTQVYVSHGWESMCFARPMSAGKAYRSYVKMQPTGGKVMAGDVILFEEEEIIGVIEGIKFQCIPRTLLNTFLPPGGPPSQKSVPATLTKPIQESRVKETSQAVIGQSLAASGGRPQITTATRALNVVAEEIGVPISELSDNVIFEDMGVDSLMSLTILARLREQLDMEISPNVFADRLTVADFLGNFSRDDSASGAAILPIMDEDSNTSFPHSRDDSSLDSSCPTTPVSAAGDEDTINAIRVAIADNMGVALEEITGEIDLASLGMDSLMTLTILASLRETTGQELSSEFFVDYPSIAAIEGFLCPKSKPTVVMSAPNQPDDKQTGAEMTNSPAATSFLLQGNPKIAEKTLFLFPDGSGSATSYTSISTIGSEVAVYGLNCPFMKTPEDFLCGIDGVSTLYKAEVQRRKPKGPYYLGGWSAGGVIAYEVALQLMQEGHPIERLILLDAPCPVRLEPLPARLHHFFDKIGLLGTGTGTVPSWLLPHFESSIRALDIYRPAAMDPDKAPRTFAIWARDGVCGNPEDPKFDLQEDDPRSMRWLLENRTDFGSNGWDVLLGEGKMQFATVKSNHFSMMRLPTVHDLAALIRKGLQ